MQAVELFNPFWRVHLTCRLHLDSVAHNCENSTKVRTVISCNVEIICSLSLSESFPNSVQEQLEPETKQALEDSKYDEEAPNHSVRSVPLAVCTFHLEARNRIVPDVRINPEKHLIWHSA